MSRTHEYGLEMRWTGNTGSGTASYRGYERSHVLRAPGKPDLPGSSDAVFRGDPTRWNPEELLVASLSACHMLGYLHQAALAGVVVTAYTDAPVGEMIEDSDSGQFRQVRLQPTVTVADPAMVHTAEQLHALAHDKCFIANSVNFPVTHVGVVEVDPAPALA
jgi:organic hydroperoxide reductase OsmC/OhrA